MQSPRSSAVRLAGIGAVLALSVASCGADQPDVLVPERAVATDRPVVPAGGGADLEGRVVGFAMPGVPTLLRTARSCDAVLSDLQSIEPSSLLQGGGFFGPAVDVTVDDVAEAGTDGERASVEDSDTGRDAASSDTNTQEAGVDEPDIVEVGTDHVYVTTDDRLLVLDAATAAVVGRLDLDTYGNELLAAGDRLIVISTDGGSWREQRGAIEDGTVDEGTVDDGTGRRPGPTADPPPFAGPVTVLTLVDVADPTAPTVLQRTEVEGTHVDTRVVDGVARIVVSSGLAPTVLEDVTRAGVDGEFRSDDELAQNVADVLARTTLGDWLPDFRTTDFASGDGIRVTEGSAVGCDQVLVPEVGAGGAETSILAMDFVDGFDPAHTTTIVAQASAVYAATDVLYLAATRWDTEAPDGVGPDTGATWSTALHAFDLGAGDLGAGGAASHRATGAVPGSLLNSYSLSEWEGHLRVATTEGAPWERDGSSSGVHVLAVDGDRLVETGAVTDLGRTETIQSVRFMGPVGYVVTFRRTDPLFVIDLADPAAPALLGELKIPGFSSYLHPAGEGRLIGVGRDADLDGRDRGFQLSLFDVSDPADPRRLQTFTVASGENEDGYGWAGSAAERDPHAFLWWSPDALAAMPFEQYHESFTDEGDGEFTQRQGVLVVRVSDEAITEQAFVVASIDSDGAYPLRAVVVHGRLWSLFSSGVASSDLATPAAATWIPFI